MSKNPISYKFLDNLINHINLDRRKISQKELDNPKKECLRKPPKMGVNRNTIGFF